MKTSDFQTLKININKKLKTFKKRKVPMKYPYYHKDTLMYILFTTVVYPRGEQIE